MFFNCLAISILIWIFYALTQLRWRLNRVLRELSAIQKLLTPVTPPSVLHAVINFGGKEVTSIMLTDIQTGEVVATILDAEGNPTTLPAGITWGWASSNTAIATVVSDPADPTGLSGIVTPNPTAGNLGSCQITGSSSDGKITASIACQVVGSAAAQATLSLTPIVPAAPAPSVPVSS